MKFITISQEQLDDPKEYVSIQEEHILISIRDPKENITMPISRYRKELLEIEFTDVEEITLDSFDRDAAKKIFEFVENHCNEVDTIIVHSNKGISRSVAVASALSKIINHKDDEVFSKGIPNMLVYINLLDFYFQNINIKPMKWNKIHYLRDRGINKCLDAFKYRQWKMKEEV